MSAIKIENVHKSFGAVKALDGINLEVAAGNILGLLGPNGAGKTTLVRILTTLLTPDSGQAQVLGFDVEKQAEKLREVIGLAGQYAAVDENLTGFENLELVGKLYHLPASEVSVRASELLGQFELNDAKERTVKTYSGGMRRRLDLAASLMNKPRVLFLDEPTTGLDLPSRLSLWKIIKNLVADSTTVLLTTQYLEEADQLANQIAVVDHGRIIAEGSPKELKSRLGSDVLEVLVADPASQSITARVIADLGTDEPKINAESGWISLPVAGNISPLLEVIRRLDNAGIKIADIHLRQPTLDDVFLSLTGKHVAET